MEAFQSYRVVRAGKIEQVQTADGLKRFVKDAVREPDQTLYHTRMHFDWQQDEHYMVLVNMRREFLIFVVIWYISIRQIERLRFRF